MNKIIDRFNELDEDIKSIYFSLLGRDLRFESFFGLIAPLPKLQKNELVECIEKKLGNKIQSPKNLLPLSVDSPIELAYIISVLANDIEEIKSIPPKLFFDYPGIQEQLNSIAFSLEKEISNLENSSDKYFNFKAFKSFTKASHSKTQNNLFEFGPDKFTQKDIIESSLRGKHCLAVIPTGGGKTFAFQLPAIIKAAKLKVMTVVISPLQALMKDQIFNFEKKLSGMIYAKAYSGFLNIIEKRDVKRDIMNGSVDILYLAPESLRTKSLQNLLKYRFIDRIVIDEAHCLSTWGNDFRHDYYYIAEFIRRIKDEKYTHPIPISCFTATANPNTIEEIEEYFEKELDVNFTQYIALPERVNLNYSAIKHNNKKEKLNTVIPEVIKIKGDGACLVYNPSSRKQCEVLADELSTNSTNFQPFHAGLSREIKHDTLEKFIENIYDGIVATTAFGMGIDKSDIRHVIHYEPSSTLEDYMQESGRAGRDGKESQCQINFTNEDIDKLFFSLLRKIVTHAEIKKILQSIKRYKGRMIGDEKHIIVSIRELAEKVGMKADDESSGFDVKIKTAILELERAGYLERGYNVPKVLVTSRKFETMEQLTEILKDKGLISNLEKSNSRGQYDLIKEISSAIIKRSTLTSNIHIEELADQLQIDPQELNRYLYYMRDLGVLGLEEDLMLSDIKRNKLIKLSKDIGEIKAYLLEELEKNECQKLMPPQGFQIKQLNQKLKSNNIEIEHYEVLLKGILKNLKEERVFKLFKKRMNTQVWYVKIENREKFKKKIHQFFNVLIKIIQYINNSKRNNVIDVGDLHKIEYGTMVDKCNVELDEEYPMHQYDKATLLIHDLSYICVEGGRVIFDSKIEVCLKEFGRTKSYTKDEYMKRMDPMYQRKRSSIHILNRYLQLLSEGSDDKAKLFTIDYFTLESNEFKRKYELTNVSKLPISEERHKAIYDNLTSEQKEIVKEYGDDTSNMLILAGPGTGKTKVLIDKIVRMIIDGNYKSEHFLMLTFTQSAKLEFKRRLHKQIGNLAYEVDIHTFHSYASDLLGAYSEKLDEVVLGSIIPDATKRIISGEISLPYKNVIVLDEYQDVNETFYAFIKALYEQFSNNKNEEQSTDVRVIAVADDDQCIMDFVGADIKFIKEYEQNFEAKRYLLTENFRSTAMIVECANEFIAGIENRLDSNKTIKSYTSNTGEVNLHYYQSPDFLTEILPFIQNSEEKNIAVIAYKNQQVLDLYSILKEDTLLDVSYLLRREGFKLFMLDEIYYFTQYIENKSNKDNHIIPQAIFNNAKKDLKEKYARSEKLTIVLKHIDEFDDNHELFTLSFWNNYTYETTVGELENIKSKVVISTIHRIKGMEFDEVHVILQNEKDIMQNKYCSPQDNLDNFKRLYYVALTRAKSILHIHSYPRVSFKALDSIAKVQENPSKLFNLINNRIFIMELEDVYLGYRSNLEDKQNIFSGNKVELEKITKNERKTFRIKYKGKVVGETSKAFRLKLDKYLSDGHIMGECSIEHVVQYPLEDKNTNQVVINKIFLCRVNLVRQKEA